MQMLYNDWMPTTPGQQLHASCKHQHVCKHQFTVVVQIYELCLEARGPPGQSGLECQAGLEC